MDKRVKKYFGPALKSYRYEGESVIKFASIGLFSDKEVSKRLTYILLNKIDVQLKMLKDLRSEFYENVDNSEVLLHNENINTLLTQEKNKYIYLNDFVEGLTNKDGSTPPHVDTKNSQNQRKRILHRNYSPLECYNDMAILHVSEVHEDVTSIVIRLLLFLQEDILPKIESLDENFPSAKLRIDIMGLLKYCFSGKDDFLDLINEFQDTDEYCVSDVDCMLFEHWARIKDEFDDCSYDKIVDDDEITCYSDFFPLSDHEIITRRPSAFLRKRRFELIDKHVIRPYVKMLLFLLLSKNDFDAQSLLLRTIISTFIFANEDVLNEGHSPILSANRIFAILNNDHQITNLFLYSLHLCGELTFEGFDKLHCALESGNLELTMSVLWAEKRARLIIERFEHFFLLASLINCRVEGNEIVSEDKLSNILEDSFKSVLKIDSTDKAINEAKYYAILTIHETLMDNQILGASESKALACIITANSSCKEEYGVMSRLTKIMLIANATTKIHELQSDDCESNDTEITNKITTKQEKDDIKCSIDAPYISSYDVDKLVKLLTTSNEYTDRAFVTIVSSGTHDVQTCLKYFISSSLKEFIECKDALQFKLKWMPKSIVSLKLLIKLLIHKDVAKNEVIDENKYDGITDKLNNQNAVEFWKPVKKVFNCKTIMNAKLGDGRYRDNYIKDLETIVEIVYASRRNKE